MDSKVSPLLKIQNLTVSINKNLILNNFNLTINKGEIHAIMGPNGSGKSTFAKVIAGHPSYLILKGEIFFKQFNLLTFTPNERANLGIFLAFQYPIEIPGVSNTDFLRIAYNAKQKFNNKPEQNPVEFLRFLKYYLDSIKMKHSFLIRNVNEGFSGGEKKLNEILQMMILNPDLCILDEMDSGLDIDALKNVANNINRFMSKEKSIILITHYQRLLNYIKPTFVHVMNKGEIIKTGSFELAKTLEMKGYKWLNT